MKKVVSTHPHKEIIDLLSEQVSKENQVSFVYLQMAMWAETHALPGTAKFFYEQSAEERMHMLKIVSYLTNLGEQPPVYLKGDIKMEYDSLEEVVKDFLLLEKENTASIHAIVQRSLSAGDLATFQFLQWFVEEQREEETVAQKMCDLFEIMSMEGLGLYTIDQEIDKMCKKA